MTDRLSPPMSTPVRRLHSLGRTTVTRGENMSTSPVLDVVEQLLNDARHPDITAVTRYGPGLGPWGPTVQKSRVQAVSGVRVRHQSTSTASLWEAVWPGEIPVPVPAVPLPVSRRAPRLAVLVAQLLDAAQPPQFRSWQLVALPGIGPADEQGMTPYGVSIVTADGSRMLLCALSTGATLGTEPTEEPFPDYSIPEGIGEACRKASAVTAGRA